MGDVTRGRLFRVTTKAAEKYRPASIMPLSIDGLILEGQCYVGDLCSPNEARRYLGWQSLLKLGEKAKPLLERLINDQLAKPHHRARALWALTSMERRHLAVGNVMARSPHSLEKTLADLDPNLRVTAIRAARQLWQQKQPEKLREVVASVIEDESAAVRREAAIALRYFGDALSSIQWSKIFNQSQSIDRWEIEALGIGFDWFATERNEAANQIREGERLPNPDLLARMMWRMNKTAKLWADPFDWSRYTQANPDDPYGTAGAKFLKEKPSAFLRSLQLLSYHHREEVAKAALSIFLKADAETALASTALLDRNSIAANPEAKARLEALLKPVVGKPEFIDLVQRLNLTGFEQELVDYITAHPDAAESINAARILAANVGKTVAFLTQADAASAKKLIAALGKVSDRPSVAVLNQAFWPEKREDVRRSMVEALALSGEGGRAILKWNAEKKLPDAMKTTAALALSRSTDAGLRTQAAAELPLPAAMGAEKFPPLAELMKLPGDASKGQALFLQAGCAACHQVKGQFINFGPDLSQIGNKLSKDGLFTAILYPSAAIEHSFNGLTISAKNGGSFTGYVISETDTELTLRLNGGATQTIAKSSITNRSEMKDSLMPPGLAAAIGPQGLADLVAWLQTLK